MVLSVIAPFVFEPVMGHVDLENAKTVAHDLLGKNKTVRIIDA